MNGICPSCRSPGEVGTPCRERVCARRDFHFVPGEALAGSRTPDELVGLKLGNYVLINLLGAGGFGRVYHAIRLPLHMPVALKILHDTPVAAAKEERLRLFAQEAKAMARLSHPNIVRLLDFGSHDGTAFIVTEFVAGRRTLKSEIRDRATSSRPMESPEIKSILSQITAGLEAAHMQGVIHRDIKPDNIMLQAAPGHPHFVRILDFGLAKFIDERSHTQSLMGTPLYMAPEQMEGRHLGPWTDLYAVGIMAYELMTGYRPFPYEHAAILLAKRDPRYDVLESIAGLSIPDAVKAFFRKALAQSPDARYRSAREFAAGLDTAFAEVQRSSERALHAVDVSRLVVMPPPHAAPVPAKKIDLPPIEPVPSRIPPTMAAPIPVATEVQVNRVAPTEIVRPEMLLPAGVGRRAGDAAGSRPKRAQTHTTVKDPPPFRNFRDEPNEGPIAGRVDLVGSVDTEDQGGADPSAPSSRRWWTVAGAGAAIGLGIVIATSLGAGDERPVPVAATKKPPEPAAAPRQVTGELEGVDKPARVSAPAPAKPAPVPPAPAGFVRVEPGSFTMGSPSDEPARGSDEIAHEVRVTRAFWIQIGEVTQGDWRRRIGTNPSMFSACGDSCPVDNVTWFDAVAYANRVSFEEGLAACYEMVGCDTKAPGIAQCREIRFRGLDCAGYRLPTEAEWEYAARAGTSSATPAGPLVIAGPFDAPVLVKQSWYAGNSAVDYKGAATCRGSSPKEKTSACGPHQVREKAPNPWGLHDMLGNLREWVNDGYEPYPAAAASDPIGASAGHRVARGGSWSDEARHLRSAARGHESPQFRNGLLGFRLARTAR